MTIIKVDESKKPREFELNWFERSFDYNPREVFGEAATDQSRARDRYWRRAYHRLLRELLKDEDEDEAYHIAEITMTRAMNQERAKYGHTTRDRDDGPEATC